MKKVRFESPKRDIFVRMDERECHSPRPFIEKQAPSHVPDFYQYQRIVPFSNDPVQRYESSDSSPYPMANKTKLTGVGDPNWKPNHELDLSMLDVTCHEPRQPFSKANVLKEVHDNRIINQHMGQNVLTPINNNKQIPSPSFDSLNKSNKIITPPNVLRKDDGFFIRRDNLDKYRLDSNPLDSQSNKLTINKENDPFARKAEIMTIGVPHQMQHLPETVNCLPPAATVNDDCRCHHCIKTIQNNTLPPNSFRGHCQNINNMIVESHNFVTPSPRQCFPCDQMHFVQNTCHCGHTNSQPMHQPQNAVDKKTWAIEKYEQNKINACLDVEKQCNVKEKREPTVSDLFKIIKLQNEQLQLLQEKVDMFISTSNQGQQNVPSMPIQNYMTEHVALQTIDSEQHKISIGVMTSFEMVRTSTVINKEVLKHTTENAQIQCNRSQISIKEVVSKSQPANLNFLDGIMPMCKMVPEKQIDCASVSNQSNDEARNGDYQQSDNVFEEKTLNELSLYNVQVDNSTTPLISPDQTLYLDVRDYSDSESGSDDQSNVGWTYYNKVMTHVNGMLQDSDMPSSASALCRNTRQQCLQMQIDKTNVSVTKRVKFGDDPLGIQSTDTSLKMNQLAAKYLNISPQLPQHLTVRPTTGPTDMSFGTRNYMERHKLLQGLQKSTKTGEMPRFLDITALKQQTKLL